jgi:osmotically-inducible protein OsmY
MEHRNQDQYGQSYGRDYEHPGYEDTGFGHDNSRGTRMPRQARPEMQGGYRRGGHDQYGDQQQSATDASDVSITAIGGKVMLEGSVTQRRMKYLIEDVVEDCGAKDVENRLQVRMESA